MFWRTFKDQRNLRAFEGFKVRFWGHHLPFLVPACRSRRKGDLLAIRNMPPQVALGPASSSGPSKTDVRCVSGCPNALSRVRLLSCWAGTRRAQSRLPRQKKPYPSPRVQLDHRCRGRFRLWTRRMRLVYWIQSTCFEDREQTLVHGGPACVMGGGPAPKPARPGQGPSSAARAVSGRGGRLIRDTMLPHDALPPCMGPYRVASKPGAPLLGQLPVAGKSRCSSSRTDGPSLARTA